MQSIEGHGPPCVRATDERLRCECERRVHKWSPCPCQAEAEDGLCFWCRKTTAEQERTE